VGATRRRVGGSQLCGEQRGEDRGVGLLTLAAGGGDDQLPRVGHLRIISPRATERNETPVMKNSASNVH